MPDDAPQQPTSPSFGGLPPSGAAGPAAPAQAPPPAMGAYKPQMPKSKMMKIAGAAVAIVIVIALIYHFATATAPAITVQTTIITTNFNVNSCETITLPGTYHFTDNITTTSTSGACIRVASGNVKLEGNGHGIVGSGPFTISGTRSYGVLVDSGSWAIISNLTIAKFSYGVFINGSNNNQVNNVTVRNSTLSGIRSV